MITISKGMREENEVLAEFFEVINEALEANPNMSLMDFAKEVDWACKTSEYNKLIALGEWQIQQIINQVHGGGR